VNVGALTSAELQAILDDPRGASPAAVTSIVRELLTARCDRAIWSTLHAPLTLPRVKKRVPPGA
jgi:hypothetical protein